MSSGRQTNWTTLFGQLGDRVGSVYNYRRTNVIMWTVYSNVILSCINLSDDVSYIFACERNGMHKTRKSFQILPNE